MNLQSNYTSYWSIKLQNNSDIINRNDNYISTYFEIVRYFYFLVKKIIIIVHVLLNIKYLKKSIHTIFCSLFFGGHIWILQYANFNSLSSICGIMLFKCITLDKFTPVLNSGDKIFLYIKSIDRNSFFLQYMYMIWVSIKGT